LKYSILLVYANKQDIENCKTIPELAQIYEFDKIKDHEWHIQACSAKTGEGLVAGLEWLSERLVLKKNTKFPNNPYKINSNFSVN
jgi:signal recognition particle receptor subunit beta